MASRKVLADPTCPSGIAPSSSTTRTDRLAPHVRRPFAQEWQTQQQHYLDIHHSWRSAAVWAWSFLPTVVRIGKRQWKHRNDCKHHKVKKHERQQSLLINQSIIHKCTRGRTHLLQADKRKLNGNLPHLLKKNLTHRRQWWFNISRARRRHERITRQNQEWVNASKEQSALLHWCRTGRLPNT